MEETIMAVAEKVEIPETNPFFVSPERRAELAKIAREVNAKAGITGRPTMTAEELQTIQIAGGVRPEDNGATRELLQMRYGDDYEQE